MLNLESLYAIHLVTLAILLTSVDTGEIYWGDTPGEQLDKITNFIKEVSLNVTPVSSVSLFTVPLCPTVDYFEPVLIDTLSCRDHLADKTRTYEPVEIHRVREDHFHAKVKTCTCTGREVTRTCFMHFFGPLEKEESETTRPVPDEVCYKHCDSLWKTQQTSLHVGGPPEWSCYWMQKTTVTSPWVIVKMIWVRGDLLNERIIHPSLVNGECPLSSQSCEFANGAKLVIQDKPSYKVKDITPSTQYAEVYETRPIIGIDRSSDWIWIRSIKTHKPHLLSNKCCVVVTDPSKQCILRSSAGQYFVSHATEPKLCDSNQKMPILPLIPEVSMDPSVEVMLLRQQVCHVTKQSVMNAAAARNPILQEVMKVFDNPSDDGLTVWKYFTSGGKILKSACGLVSFDEPRWMCPNVWVLHLRGVKVGCYDQLTDLAHTSGCTCHRLQSNNSFLSEFVPMYNARDRTWVARRLRGSIPEIISELASASIGYMEYINSLQTPSGVIVYSDPIPKAIVDKVEERSIRSGSKVGQWFANLFNNVRSFFTGVGVLGLLACAVMLGLFITARVVGMKGKK